MKSPARLMALGAPCIKLSTDSLPLALLAPLNGHALWWIEIFKVFFFIATPSEYIQKIIYANEFLPSIKSSRRLLRRASPARLFASLLGLLDFSARRPTYLPWRAVAFLPSFL